MKNVKKLKSEGIEYEETYWKWLEPYYIVKTRDYSPSNDIEVMRYDEFCELNCDRLAEEDPESTYLVVYKPRPEGSRHKSHVHLMTVVKIKEG